MHRRLLTLFILMIFLLAPSCKLIYPNRTPVVKPKNRMGWYKPAYKKRKRTKIVWMKTHQAKKVKQGSKNDPKKAATTSEAPATSTQETQEGGDQ